LERGSLLLLALVLALQLLEGGGAVPQGILAIPTLLPHRMHRWWLSLGL